MADVCQGHEMMLKNFQQFQENQKEIVTAMANMRERIVEAEQSTKSAHHRLNNMEEQTKAIVRMLVSVELVIEKMNDVLTILKEHSERMDDQDEKSRRSRMHPHKQSCHIGGCSSVLWSLVVRV